jgi:hypothetical protein
MHFAVRIKGTPDRDGAPEMGERQILCGAAARRFDQGTAMRDGHDIPGPQLNYPAISIMAHIDQFQQDISLASVDFFTLTVGRARIADISR